MIRTWSSAHLLRPPGAPAGSWRTPSSRPALRTAVAILALLTVTSACVGTTDQMSTPRATPVATEILPPRGQAGGVPVTIGLPYRPDVQFTPVYVAERAGHFAAAGLDPRLEYGDESDFVRLVAAGRLTAVIASGEQVILARADGLPVTYVMTWYQRFPGVVFSLKPELGTPAALVGHTVGLPALSGASYIGWQALLAANDIAATSITTEVVGFEQLAAVRQGRVEAAVGYAANEPVQLRADGADPAVILIADSFNLVSNGLVVSQALIDDHPEVVQALVESLWRGLRQTLDDPDGAFEVALRVLPEAADPAVRDRQRAVLAASLPFWQGEPLGAIDAQAWQRSQDFLVDVGMVAKPLPVSELIDDRFVTAIVAP